MTIARELLEDIKKLGIEVPEETKVMEIQEVLESLGVEGVDTEVVYEGEAGKLVQFSYDDEVKKVFFFEEEGDPHAGIVDEHEDEITEINLTELDEDASIEDFSWMDKYALVSILAANEEDESIDEAMKTVVRGGKKVKVKVKTRKKKASAKQKLALAKARKKAHTGAAKKKRAKSSKIRKRLGI